MGMTTNDGVVRNKGRDADFLQLWGYTNRNNTINSDI